MMRGCGRLEPLEHLRLEPLEHLRQLPFKQLEFGDLLLDGAQLLRHECMQAGTHCQTLSAVEFRRQGFEIGEGES
jgi:hypothetical protein